MVTGPSAVVDGLQQAQQRERDRLDPEHTHKRRAEAGIPTASCLALRQAPVANHTGPHRTRASFRARSSSPLPHCRFLHRASFALIASCTNTASPSARFSKYSVKRASAVYISPRHRCISWLHG